MITIRQLEKTDVAVVAKIAKASMPYPWNETVFSDCFGRDYYAWVVEKQEKIVGFIVILLQDGECQLMNIAINPDCQRQGLAQQLLKQAVTFAKSRQVKQLLLEVRKSNQAAINFYKNSGGKQIAVRKDYYPSATGREDALIFSLHL